MIFGTTVSLCYKEVFSFHTSYSWSVSSLKTRVDMIRLYQTAGWSILQVLKYPIFMRAGWIRNADLEMTSVPTFRVRYKFILS